MPLTLATSLPVRVREGAGDDTLVLLHGRGADEHDLFGLFDLLDPERRLRGITVGGPTGTRGHPRAERLRSDRRRLDGGRRGRACPC